MSLVKNSSIYLGSEIVNKAIPFLLLPIITNHLTPIEYGIYGMYQVVLSFLIPFIGMSLDINITRNYFKLSKEKISTIISSILLILHLNVFIGLIGVYIVTLIFKNPFGIPANILYLMPIIIYSQTINAFNLLILRNDEKALAYGMFQSVITVINFSMALLLLLFFHKNWMSLVYGVLLANGMVAIYSFLYLKKKFDFKWKFYSFREIYSISLPLIFHLLGGSIIFLSDRVFIQQLTGLKDVGLYTIGSQFGMITMVVINAIIMAVNPWMYKELAKKTHEITKKIYGLMVLFLLIGIVIYLGSLIVFPYMVNSRYDNAKDVIFWISLAFVFRGWYQLYYNIIVHEGYTKIFMYITFSVGILNLILNYFLIKSNGMIGAAEATAIAFFIMFLSTYLYVNKISNLRVT